MAPIAPIHTSRLIVREFQPEDRDALLSVVRDPTQIEHMMLDLDTEERLDSFLQVVHSAVCNAKRLDWHFAVQSRGEGVYLGSGCLMIDPEAQSSAELGYWFLREAWGKGYATEVSRALLKFGFSELGLHRIWAKCHERNGASSHVLEKLGMRYEGTLREHVWLRDHFRSSKVYGLLVDEYRVAQQGSELQS